MTNAFRQNLVGQRVRGTWVGRSYTGTIVESIQDGEDFNHIIRLDITMVMTWTQMGYPAKYKNYKPWTYTHLNHNTARKPIAGEESRHIVELDYGNQHSTEHRGAQG